jgi:hypothetical protein
MSKNTWLVSVLILQKNAAWFAQPRGGDAFSVPAESFMSVSI